ncbi:general odorant-binding protein 69a isoform X2 [Tribolium castaneum]|uniref:Odorant binding protein 08 n=1 Tax=Tribolium castaneum TaxID=7070 RepID=D6WM81_TRICA|nr:PREDICTED: general odorant-binding protein 69a isoform X2 [Tribolium castaneum]EFA04687.2 odorant binding protein 08 [Tribolium castaneum]|eukprot:XP_015835845.1 PREDICTED: general odorant-binding protein 69a isoform X2 [Tribolium castaneum]
MIRYYIVLLLYFFAPPVLGISEEMQELVNQLHSTCVAETGVSEDLINKVNSDKVMIDDEKLKCYIKCLLTETGCISDDGVVDVEATIALLPEDMKAKTTPVIRSCGAKMGANPCESAWLTHKCYLETSPADYVLI